MALSEMSSKEKTIVAILGVVIVLALVGIGILAARLLGGGDADGSPPIVVASATPAGGARTTATLQPGAEMTPVAPPALEEPKEMPAAEGTRLAAGQPVAVAQAESVGPLAPAIIASQTLYAGHRYRIEIAAADGSQVAIQGSWSQAATSKSGQAAAPQIEFFEGTTPHNIRVEPPVADPEMWGCSVSASLKEPLGKATHLVITIWDVTGSE